jgi:hypothetical protein
MLQQDRPDKRRKHSIHRFDVTAGDGTPNEKTAFGPMS